MARQPGIRLRPAPHDGHAVVQVGVAPRRLVGERGGEAVARLHDAREPQRLRHDAAVQQRRRLKVEVVAARHVVVLRVVVDAEQVGGAQRVDERVDAVAHGRLAHRVKVEAPRRKRRPVRLLGARRPRRVRGHRERRLVPKVCELAVGDGERAERLLAPRGDRRLPHDGVQRRRRRRRREPRHGVVGRRERLHPPKGGERLARRARQIELRHKHARSALGRLGPRPAQLLQDRPALSGPILRRRLKEREAHAVERLVCNRRGQDGVQRLGDDRHVPEREARRGAAGQAVEEDVGGADKRRRLGAKRGEEQRARALGEQRRRLRRGARHEVAAAGHALALRRRKEPRVAERQLQLGVDPLRRQPREVGAALAAGRKPGLSDARNRGVHRRASQVLAVAHALGQLERRDKPQREAVGQPRPRQRGRCLVQPVAKQVHVQVSHVEALVEAEPRSVGVERKRPLDLGVSHARSHLSRRRVCILDRLLDRVAAHPARALLVLFVVVLLDLEPLLLERDDGVCDGVCVAHRVVHEAHLAFLRLRVDVRAVLVRLCRKRHCGGRKRKAAGVADVGRSGHEERGAPHDEAACHYSQAGHKPAGSFAVQPPLGKNGASGEPPEPFGHFQDKVLHRAETKQSDCGNDRV